MCVLCWITCIIISENTVAKSIYIAWTGSNLQNHLSKVFYSVFYLSRSKEINGKEFSVLWKESNNLAPSRTDNIHAHYSQVCRNVNCNQYCCIIVLTIFSSEMYVLFLIIQSVSYSIYYQMPTVLDNTNHTAIIIYTLNTSYKI